MQGPVYPGGVGALFAAGEAPALAVWVEAQRVCG